MSDNALLESRSATATIELMTSSTEECLVVDAAELAIRKMTADLGSGEILPAAFPGVPFVSKRTPPKIRWEIAPKKRLAMTVFEEKKGEWQREHAGQWAALCGEDLLGFANSDSEADERYNPDGSLTPDLFVGFIEADPSTRD